MRYSRSIPAALLLSAVWHGALAQETIPYAGGEFTITEEDDATKVLAFDGKELARDYFVFFNGLHEIAGSEVALFEVGEGGNACGADTLIVWNAPERGIEAVQATDDCNAPSAAISAYAIYFVPYLLPGETQPVRYWSPDAGLKLAGNMAFSPQPGTRWSDVSPPGHMMDVFENEAVYEASRALLGSDLTEVVRGLSVGGEPNSLGEGQFWSRGCVPHACGVSDSFMAVDAKAGKVYFAQQQDGGGPKAWPDAATWPKPLRDAMAGAIGR
ncbi:MAG: hypothetical protein KF849_12905 [Rhizobiaceae bacterium]|nr:hypothetical protein [Rhizobiaceae bacterium]